MHCCHPIGDLTCRLRHAIERDESSRSPRLVRGTAAANEKRLVNRRADREIRALGIVAGDDKIDVKAVRQELPFVDARGAGTGGGGQNLAENAPVLAQQRIGERREKCTDAVRVDQCGSVRVGCVNLASDFELSALDPFLHVRAESPPMLLVVGERRVHQHNVHAANIRRLGQRGLLGRDGRLLDVPDQIKLLAAPHRFRQQFQAAERHRLVGLRAVPHRVDVHGFVINGGCAKGEVRGGELRGLIVDVQAADGILHELLVCLANLLWLHRLRRRHAFLDGLERRHQQRAGAAGRVQDAQAGRLLPVRPVH